MNSKFIEFEEINTAKKHLVNVSDIKVIRYYNESEKSGTSIFLDPLSSPLNVKVSYHSLVEILQKEGLILAKV